MGRIAATMPSFCLTRIRPVMRVRSPADLPTKKCTRWSLNSSWSIRKISDQEEKVNLSGNDVVNKKAFGNVVMPEMGNKNKGRKIMLVADSSAESKRAICWALTHAVQNQDLVILLFFKKCFKSGDQCVKEISPGVSEYLSCMKIMCQQKRPEVEIEISVAEGKEKGPTILKEAKMQGVALLVLGQKRRATVTWRLLKMWAGQRAAGGGFVEYCIQNASCMAIAVRRKSKKLGGYLITTKRHKDFWLLA